MFRKIITLILSLLLTVIGQFPANITWAQGKVYTIAVLNFDANGVSVTEAKGLSDILRHRISSIIESQDYRSDQNKDQYKIVERADMDKILEQFEIQSTGCVSDSCAVEFGKMLQVDRIVIGRISLIGRTFSVTSRIIDVETAVQIGSSNRQHRGSVDDLIQSVMPQVAGDLLPIRKKSKKLYYILGCIVIAGGAAAVIFGGKDNGGSGSTEGILILDVPDLPDEP